MKKTKKNIDINNILNNENIYDVDIATEIKTSTINYAMSVITDRALPDIRDGLKPAQRRNIYATYNKKILPTSNYVKCAEISGEVMGKYHPHGCSRFNTKIMLTNGTIVQLGDLFNSSEKEFEILCVNNNGKITVSKMHHIRIGQYTNKIYHIILSNDADIQVTDNHPFLLDNLQWKRADELKINDKLFSSCILTHNNNDFYPIIKQQNNRMKFLHLMVGEYKYGSIEPYYHIHHNDNNVLNFSTDNLIKLSTSKHSKVYCKRHRSLVGFDKGRDRMFNGDLKEQIKIKNSNEVYKNINYINTKETRVRKTRIQKTPKLNNLYIKKIYIETVDNEPMYDFTVDKYENALFLANIEKTNNNINQYNLVCLHNSTYLTLCNMGQEWKMRYPLIDFHGNKGSIDGEGPAAERYTEARLHKNAMELLTNIDENSVEFVPNYSETLMEPVVLPGLLPNLLINGSCGIAVGYTTQFPSHNLSEVIDGIIQVIKNPQSTLQDIMKHIKGPDFPMGSYLINKNIVDLYNTGKAQLTFKAKHFIETNEETKNSQIVFFELPPNTNKAKLVEKVYNLCIEKKQIPRIIDVRDESNGDDGIRIVIELHKTAILDIVLNELFKKTDLQQNITYVMNCIIDKTPKVVTLKQYIDEYIKFQKEVHIKTFNNILKKLNKKLHIQEGYQKINTNLTQTIDIIRSAENDEMAKSELIKYFNLSEEQANIILDMKLRNITKLGSKNVDDIIKELNKKINYHNELLNDDNKLNNLLIQELKDLKKRMGDNRRTEIIDEEEIIVNKNIDKEIMIALTNKNNIKQYEIDTFKELVKKGYKEKSEIFLQWLQINTSDNLLLIFNTGNYMCITFDDLLCNINTLVEKQIIIKIIPLTKDNLDKVILLITKNGLVKKCYLNKFKTKKKIFNLVELDNNDNIINVEILAPDNNNIITIASSNGLIHRFYVDSFKETTPGGKGLCSMSLKDNIISDVYISKLEDDDKKYLIIYAKDNEQYYIKKIKLNEFLVKGRIAKGTKAINFTEKSPGIIIKIIITSSNFIIMNNKGIEMLIDLDSIKESNKNTKGEKINYDILMQI